MHLNHEVVDLFFDDKSGAIKEIGNVYSPQHLPIGVIDERGIISNKNLIEWWIDRRIPLSRSGIEEAIDKLNVTNTNILLLKCSALSLSDQYWIKPKETDIKWEDINFFDNDFSNDIGELLFG